MREPRLPDEHRGLGRLQDGGQRVLRKAYPFLAGDAQVHGGSWRHDEAVARTGTAMSDKHVPTICEAALKRDGFRVGVPISCNVTGP